MSVLESSLTPNLARIGALAFAGALSLTVAACAVERDSVIETRGSGDAGAGGSSNGGGGGMAGGASSAGTSTTGGASTAGTSTGGASSGGTPGGGTTGGGTTGASSAGTADGGAPTPSLSCGSLPVCDDFESATAGGPPNAATWAVVTPDCSGTGALAVDDTQAHSGTRSVKVTGAGGYCNHVFFSTSKVQAIGGVLFGRFFVRMGTELGDSHVTFMALKDSVEGKNVRMGGQSKILMWNRESDDATLPELSPTGIAKSLHPAANAWRCVEFQIDGPAGAITTWVDGAAVEGLAVDATATPDVDRQWKTKATWAPALIDAKFGWESYGGDANTLWFDDVALGPQRIGCGG